jgi:hypothetical protein
LLDAKIRVVVVGSFIFLITITKCCPSEKLHVNCSPKKICQKNLNGKLNTGGDTIRITNKSYAYGNQREIDHKTSSWVCMFFYNTYS